MRVHNVLMVATAATFIFCCEAGMGTNTAVVVTSKRSLRSYDMDDLDAEDDEDDEERTIRLNSVEKIDNFFGTPEHFNQVLGMARVDEAFADGKKLDDWLDKQTLDTLLAAGLKQMKPTFNVWADKGITAEGLLKR